MYDTRRHIKRVSVMISDDEIVVLTYYRPNTKVGMALTEEVLVRAATEVALDHDIELDVSRGELGDE